MIYNRFVKQFSVNGHCDPAQKTYTACTRQYIGERVEDCV